MTDEEMNECRRRDAVSGVRGYMLEHRNWREHIHNTDFWETPEFISADVCDIAVVTPKALAHFIDPKRNLVDLEGETVNPGTGRRRIFTGKHVLMIRAAFCMAEIGFPQTHSKELSTVVGSFVIARALGLVPKIYHWLVNYPVAKDDWQFHLVFEGMEKKPELPISTQWLELDRLIDEVAVALKKIVDSEGSE